MRTIPLRHSFVQTLMAVTLVAVGCGDDTTNTGGSPSTGGSGSGGDPSTGGSPSTGGNGPTAGEGPMGGNPTPVIDNCADVESNKNCAAPDPIACECGGCPLDVCADDSGFNDCVCPSCAADSFCLTEFCTDDGLCDPFAEGCLCTDCADHPSCASGWLEDCTNGSDDNGNGTVDCEDVQCASLAACVQPACDAAVAAVIGANAGDTTGGTTLITNSCQDDPASPESVYTFTPAADGFLSITLASTADLGFAVRTDCIDAATQATCVDANAGGTDEAGAVGIEAGTDITIIVKGFTAADVGTFTLTLAAGAVGGCIDDGVCSAAAGEACTCADCVTAAVCGACDGNATCDAADACTCASCDADAFCTDTANCTDDDFCDQFLEGCQCADCAAVPNCVD
jgi:hypothetical protein